MNAVETIAAAIEKLETLKAESTPKPWHDWTDDLTGEVDVWHDQEHRSHVAGCGVAGMPRVLADADLIATLHRTLDAQLAILRHAIHESSSPFFTFPLAGYDEHVITLARAILGTPNE